MSITCRLIQLEYVQIIYAVNQTARGRQPKNRQGRWLPDVLYLTRSSFGWWSLSCPAGCRTLCQAWPAVPACSAAGWVPLCSPPALLVLSSAGFQGVVGEQEQRGRMEKKRGTVCRGTGGRRMGTSAGACILQMLIITFLPRASAPSYLSRPLVEAGPVLSGWLPIPAAPPGGKNQH